MPLFCSREVFQIGYLLGTREIGWIGDGFYEHLGGLEEKDLSGARIRHKHTCRVADTFDIIDGLLGKSAARTRLGYVHQIMNASGNAVRSAIDGRLNLAFIIGTKDNKMVPMRWLVEKDKWFIDAVDLRLWPRGTRVFN